MTLIELAVVIAILGVLLILAVTTLWRSRLAGNEASAVGSLRTIERAQAAYAATCGGGNYASSLTVLGSRSSTEIYPFLNADLGSEAAPIHSGYQIRMQMGRGGEVTRPDCAGRPTVSRFYASAAPTGDDASARAFAIDEGGTIYALAGRTPPTQPFGSPAAPVR